MAFVIASTTVSSAVATNGTFTVAAPTIAMAGSIKNRGGHYFVVRGMAATFNFPVDWSVSWSGLTATITYLGTTSIPAGSAVYVQFELDGDDINYPYHAKNMNQFDTSGATINPYRGTFGQIFRVDFGAGAVSTTAALLATQALSTTTLYTLTAAQQVAATLQFPRNILIKSSTTDSTQVVTVRGFDEYGAAMTESFTLNQTTDVVGLKAWKRIVSLQADITLAGTISVGTGAKFGLPYYLPAETGTGIGHILREAQDGAAATAGTAVGGVLTKATATTGDVRGMITPNTSPDATKVYSVYMFVADPSFLGVPQYSA